MILLIDDIDSLYEELIQIESYKGLTNLENLIDIKKVFWDYNNLPNFLESLYHYSTEIVGEHNKKNYNWGVGFKLSMDITFDMFEHMFEEGSIEYLKFIILTKKIINSFNSILNDKIIGYTFLDNKNRRVKDIQNLTAAIGIIYSNFLIKEIFCDRKIKEVYNIISNLESKYRTHTYHYHIIDENIKKQIVNYKLYKIVMKLFSDTKKTIEGVVIINGKSYLKENFGRIPSGKVLLNFYVKYDINNSGGKKSFFSMLSNRDRQNIKDVLLNISQVDANISKKEDKFLWSSGTKFAAFLKFLSDNNIFHYSELSAIERTKAFIVDFDFTFKSDSYTGSKIHDQFNTRHYKIFEKEYKKIVSNFSNSKS